MFPCSSIYQNFPITNQNTMACKQLEIIEDHDHGYQNPNHDHQDPNSNQEYYSQLPTIFEDDGLMLSHLLSQKQLLMASATTTTTTTNSSSTTTCSSHDNVNITGCPSKGFSKKKQIARGGDTNKKTVNNPRRRTGKKDRHSKISTAQGLRDRRMRLSLQIARKFFDLQDMLRFDKASKTIEWLFNKSKTAIRELKASLTKRSSCSNHDTDDDEEEEEDADDDDDQILMRNISMPAKEIKKKNSVKKLHNFKVAKESRDKARARARERTREKKMLQNSTQTAQMPLKNIMVADDEALEHHHDADLVSTHEKFQAETNVADYYSTMMSSSSGAHYEDDFLGLFPPGKWELINSSSKPQSFCHMNYKPLLISSTTTPTTDIQEEKPSSIFRTSTANTSSHEENPSSVFMAAAAAQYYHEAEDPNPNHDPVFISSTTATLVSHIQDQNLPGSNVFYSTVNF